MLLATLLDGMDAALCAFDADGVVTHWNSEAERLLGWTRQDAVGRRGLSGWVALPADAADVESRLFDVRHGRGRQVHDFPLVTKDGGRVLVRGQTSRVTDSEGASAGVYCAFTDAYAQVDLERSIALSGALLEEAPWGVVLVDADLRPASVNAYAARALGGSRTSLLGQPLGELLAHGVDELEGAIQHVLAQGQPPGPTETWVTLRPRLRGVADWETAGGGDSLTAGPAGATEQDGSDPNRRCWRSAFLRLASPMGEPPTPLGVAWLFQDVTETRRAEAQSARRRFRDNQLQRAARAASECVDPMEAATVHLDFALAGFAEHALLDLAVPESPGGAHRSSTPLVRAAATPASVPDLCPPAGAEVWSAVPVGYGASHPAVRAYESGGSVRTSVGGATPPAAAVGGRLGAEGSPVVTARWAAARKWPPETVHGLCVVLRSRGRTLGVVTFLRGVHRRRFDRSDAAYAEDVAVRVAAAVDLARQESSRR
nr:PAS domain-containing protein [Streptomyces oceani]